MTQAQDVRILGIIGSPRESGNTEVMIDKALEGAATVPHVTTVKVSLAKKRVAPCVGCSQCNARKSRCIVKDDFHQLFDSYMQADGIIIGSPVYHMGVTAQLKAFIDRLGNSVCAMRTGDPRRLTKAGGAVAQGMNRFGGQEMVLQFIVNSFLTMNCVPVAGDVPQSYIGAPGTTYGSPQKGAIADNEAALESAHNVGMRVAELAKILKAGKEALRGELPAAYYLGVEEPR